MKNPKQSTRGRVLNAACSIFADKGFRETTVVEICDAAEANIAAVNYHFGDKEKLYDEVWRHAFAITTEAYPLDGGLPDDPTIEDGLYSYANAILHRIFSEDETGLFAKLLYREMAAPTLALDRIAREALTPQNEYMRSIVEKALGKEIATDQFHHCMHSIIGQCAFYNFSRPLRERVMGKRIITEEDIQQIARHIARFSLGGLDAITGTSL